MDGGYGGTDIWKVEMLKGDWGVPDNVGPEINTPGNEMFPSVRDNGELYFSSDFHTGMGGLDIFKAVYNEATKTWKVENMQVPINSAGDDFGIAFIPKRDQGMFTSNRKGSMGDDLYSFVLPPLIYRVEGQIVNSQNDLRENNAFVRVIGTDGTNLRILSNDGKFQFRLQPETEYIVAAFKDGFLNAKKNINTFNLEESKLFEVNLSITPTDAPINVDNINYEFGKHDLLPSSIVALDSLVELLKQNPTIVVEIMSHTDHVGSLEFNSALSQRRAQSVVDHLITKGINPRRLVAKGYGETWPKKVTESLANKHNFLRRGDELTEQFINRLATEEQKEIAKSINRRTEFRVLRNDFREAY
jgi:peptidoglycan-associated lipoprotein